MTWAMVRDALITGAVVMASLFLADGADVFAIDSSDGRTYLAAGIAAVIRTVIGYIDPNQVGYGRGSE